MMKALVGILGLAFIGQGLFCSAQEGGPIKSQWGWGSGVSPRYMVPENERGINGVKQFFRPVAPGIKWDDFGARIGEPEPIQIDESHFRSKFPKPDDKNISIDPIDQQSGINGLVDEYSENLAINADVTNFDESTGMARASGNVSVKQGLVTITADEVEFSQNSGMIRATGNVHMQKGAQNFNAEEIFYNTESGKVTASHIKSSLEPFDFENKESGKSIGPAVSNTNSESDFLYTIRSKTNGRVVTVSQAGTKSGSNVILWNALFSKGQVWQLLPVKDGYFRIVAKHSGLAIGIAGAGSEENANVIQKTVSESDESQLWSMETDADGYVRFTAKHSGKCLSFRRRGELNKINVEQKARLDTDDQKWLISISGLGE